VALRFNGTDPFLRASMGAFSGFVFGNQPSSFAACLKRNGTGTWQGIHVVDDGAGANVSYPMEFNPSNNIVEAMSTGDGGRTNGTAITDTTNFMIVGWTWDGSGSSTGMIFYWKIGTGSWNTFTPTGPGAFGTPVWGSGYRHIIGNEAALGDDANFDWVCNGAIESALSPTAFQSLDMSSIASWDAVFNGSGAWLLDGQSIGTRTDRTGNGGNEINRSAGITLVSDPAGWSWGTTSVFAFPRNPLAEMYAAGGPQRAQMLALIRPQLAGQLGTTFTITPSGVIVPTGSAAKQASKPLGGSTAPAGALGKQAAKPLSGATTPTGALAKLVSKPFGGAMAPTGTLAKLISKPFGGAMTPTGALGLVRVILRTFTGAITPTGTLAKQDQKPLAGATTPSGAIAKRDNKALTGAITPTGGLAKLVSKPFAGALTPSGALGLVRVILRTFTGAITPTGALTRRPAKQLAATTTPSGSLQRSTSKHVAGAITPTGALAKQIARRLVGAIAPAGTVARQVGAAIWTLLRLRSWDHRAVISRRSEHRAVDTEMRDHQADDINPSEH
jgi:hypothetical protein